jgi:hypothetical protein
MNCGGVDFQLQRVPLIGLHLTLPWWHTLADVVASYFKKIPVEVHEKKHTGLFGLT